MKKVAVIAAIAITTTAGFAQTNYVHQVIILNEGQYTYFDSNQVTPVTLGAYDPIADTYAVFSTITNARFGSDLLMDGDNIYVAADTILYVYDKNSLSLTNSTVIKGIRKLAIWNNQLLVTIGENAVAFDSYFEVYDKSSLSLIYKLNTTNGPIYSVEGISVVNDTAYLGINNALLDWMNPTGIIGIVDLNNQTYAGEVDMGVDGVNPDNLMVDGTMIYTLNNKDFKGSSISAFNTLDRTIITTNLAAPSGCGSSVLADNNIYYHRYIYDTLWNDINVKVHKYDINTQLVDSVNPNLSDLYGMVHDNINGYLYVANTDFTSWGMAYKMQYDGTLIDSFAVGVSPGTLALDIRTIVSVDDNSNETRIVIYPSIVDDVITVKFEQISSANVRILNTIGQQVLQFTSQGEGLDINVRELRSGLYFITVETDRNTVTQRFVVK